MTWQVLRWCLNAAPRIQSVWNGLITVAPLPCALHRESSELWASPWLQLLLSALPTPRSHLGPSAPCVASAGNVFFGFGAARSSENRGRRDTPFMGAQDGEAGAWSSIRVLIEQEEGVEGQGGLRKKRRGQVEVLR